MRTCRGDGGGTLGGHNAIFNSWARAIITMDAVCVYLFSHWCLYLHKIILFGSFNSNLTEIMLLLIYKFFKINLVVHIL